MFELEKPFPFTLLVPSHPITFRSGTNNPLFGVSTWKYAMPLTEPLFFPLAAKAPQSSSPQKTPSWPDTDPTYFKMATSDEFGNGSGDPRGGNTDDCMVVLVNGGRARDC